MSAWPSARSSTKREHGRIVQRGLKDEDGHTTLDTAFWLYMHSDGVQYFS